MILKRVGLEGEVSMVWVEAGGSDAMGVRKLEEGWGAPPGRGMQSWDLVERFLVLLTCWVFRVQIVGQAQAP